MLLAPAHYVVDKYGAHGRLYTYYAVKLFQILRRTLKLVGDVFFFMLLLHSMAVEVIIVRIVVISEFKSDKCDLWDKQYVRIQGQWSYHGWWMLMQKVKKEMTTTPLHTSSHFFTLLHRRDVVQLIGIQWHKVGMIIVVHWFII